MMIYPKKAELGSKERDSTALCPIRPGCSVIEVLASYFFFFISKIFDNFCNSNRPCDRSLTSKMTGWGAVMTGLDRSPTSKMTGWRAVCDRLGGGL